MKYIDAEEFIRKIGHDLELSSCMPEDWCRGVKFVLNRIKKEPAADVVEVVRCEECKHSEHWYGDKRRCFLWHEDGIDVFETGYCSYGEIKDD